MWDSSLGNYKYESKYGICGHFMSNIDKRYAKLIRKAAKETGYKIVVSKKATAIDGTPMSQYVAVYGELKDHGPFWNKFRELKAKADEAQ